MTQMTEKPEMISNIDDKKLFNVEDKEIYKDEEIFPEDEDQSLSCWERFKKGAGTFCEKTKDYFQYDRLYLTQGEKPIDLTRCHKKFLENFSQSYSERETRFAYSFDDVLKFKLKEEAEKEKQFCQQFKRFICCYGGNQMKEIDEAYKSDREYEQMVKKKVLEKKQEYLMSQNFKDDQIEEEEEAKQQKEEEAMKKQQERKQAFKKQSVHEPENIFQKQISICNSDRSKKYKKNRTLETVELFEQKSYLKQNGSVKSNMVDQKNSNSQSHAILLANNNQSLTRGNRIEQNIIRKDIYHENHIYNDIYHENTRINSSNKVQNSASKEDMFDDQKEVQHKRKSRKNKSKQLTNDPQTQENAKQKQFKSTSTKNYQQNQGYKTKQQPNQDYLFFDQKQEKDNGTQKHQKLPKSTNIQNLNLKNVKVIAKNQDFNKSISPPENNSIPISSNAKEIHDFNRNSTNNSQKVNEKNNLFNDLNKNQQKYVPIFQNSNDKKNFNQQTNNYRQNTHEKDHRKDPFSGHQITSNSFQNNKRQTQFRKIPTSTNNNISQINKNIVNNNQGSNEINEQNEIAKNFKHPNHSIQIKNPSQNNQNILSRSKPDNPSTENNEDNVSLNPQKKNQRSPHKLNKYNNQQEYIDQNVSPQKQEIPTLEEQQNPQIRTNKMKKKKLRKVDEDENEINFNNQYQNTKGLQNQDFSKQRSPKLTMEENEEVGSNVDSNIRVNKKRKNKKQINMEQHNEDEIMINFNNQEQMHEESSKKNYNDKPEINNNSFKGTQSTPEFKEVKNLKKRKNKAKLNLDEEAIDQIILEHEHAVDIPSSDLLHNSQQNDMLESKEKESIVKVQKKRKKAKVMKERAEEEIDEIIDLENL